MSSNVIFSPMKTQLKLSVDIQPLKADGEEGSDQEWDRNAGNRMETSLELNINPLQDGFGEQPLDLLIDASIRIPARWAALAQRTPDESPFFHPDVMRKRRKEASKFKKRKYSAGGKGDNGIIAHTADGQIPITINERKIIFVVKI